MTICLFPLILSLEDFNTSELVLGKLKKIEKQEIIGTVISRIICDETNRSRKEVFQPHLPVRLPCYDLTPVTSFTLGGALRQPTLNTPDFHCLTGGVYKARERIHRAIADARLLANPAS